ncbi:hypothetical protein KR009_012004 [Drosophila setifemur]|nr:hypothetical protein KR009_012004 [Drosophila setifemur]
MIYFNFCWLLIVVLLFIGCEDVLAAPKRKFKPKLPRFPKININIHHNSKYLLIKHRGT